MEPEANKTFLPMYQYVHLDYNDNNSIKQASDKQFSLECAGYCLVNTSESVVDYNETVLTFKLY